MTTMLESLKRTINVEAHIEHPLFGLVTKRLKSSSEI